MSHLNRVGRRCITGWPPAEDYEGVKLIDKPRAANAAPNSFIHRVAHRIGTGGSTKTISPTAICRTRTDLVFTSNRLLILRTQVDNRGAILAANDSDYLDLQPRYLFLYVAARRRARGPRARSRPGNPEVDASNFYIFCKDVMTAARAIFCISTTPTARSAPPGIRGSTADGNPQLPIQEDETALVHLGACGTITSGYRDVEFIRGPFTRR